MNAAWPVPARATLGWSPRVRLRQWLQHWLHQRLPVSDRHATTQRNVYIVPSPAGWFFALVLLVLLVASINYQLSLGYALTFLLAGSALVSMHITHATLRSLVLQLRAPSPVFAGDDATLEVAIDNAGRARHGIGMSVSADAPRPSVPASHALEAATPVWVDVPAQGRVTLRLKMPTRHRGWQGVPTLTAHTRFPFGLFHAWTVWRPAARVLVWPRPEHPTPPLPAGASTQAEAGLRQRLPGGEFEGVRPWRRGDSMRQVAWKKAAHSPDADLVSRETASATGSQRWLEWSAARPPGGDTEARLSRLAAWVLQCERSGGAFGLRLPGLELPLGSGSAQRLSALDALAMWQTVGGATEPRASAGPVGRGRA